MIASRTTSLTLLLLAAQIPVASAGAPPPNDDWSKATVVGALPFSDSLADVSTATTQTTDPVLPCMPGGSESRGSHSVWYRYTTSEATEYVNVSTEGSAYDTIVSVHEGEPGAFTLAPGGCNDNGVAIGQAQSHIAGLRLKPRTTYSLEVISPLALGAPAHLVLAVDPAPVYRVTRRDDPVPAPGCSPTDCSLRAAIDAANANPGAVLVRGGVTYVLASGVCGDNANVDGDLDLRSAMGIYGDGMFLTSISAGLAERVFDVDPDTLPGDPSRGNVTAHIADLTIFGSTAACSQVEDGGSGIRLRSLDSTNIRGNSRDFLALSQVEMRGGQSIDGPGGALYTHANTHIFQSRIAFNRAAHGGAIFAGSSAARTRLLLEQSTLDSNEAVSLDCGAPGHGGGAILAGANTRVRLVNATVVGNRTACHGGAIAAVGADLLARSSTIARNVANFDADALGRGGGLYLDNPGASLVNTILADNGTGAFEAGRGSLIEDDDCADISQEASTSLIATNSLIEAPTACSFTGSGNQVAVNPDLASSLAYWGGITPTLAVLTGSPTIDSGTVSGCLDQSGQVLAHDQRGSGHSRHVDGNGDGSERCDIGAFEYVAQQAADPAAPRLAPESDSGISDKDGVTNAELLNFEGECEAGQHLYLYEDNAVQGQADCLDQRYQVRLFGLAEGEHLFYVRVTIGGGPESAPSPNTRILIDRSIERPVIHHPVDGASVGGPVSVEGGHPEPGAHVFVSANGGAYCEADVFEDVTGSTLFDCSAQIDESFGETIRFEAVATDIAGNTSDPSDAVTVVQGDSIFADGFDPHD